jgi:hypothetical protein
MTWLNTVPSTSKYQCFSSKQQEEIEVEEDADGWLKPTSTSMVSEHLEKPKPYDVMVDSVPASLEKPIPKKRKSSFSKKKRRSHPMTMAQPMAQPTGMMHPYYGHQGQVQFFQPPPPYCFMPPTGMPPMGHMMGPMGHMPQAYMPQMPASAFASLPINDDELSWSTGDETAV